MTLKTPSELRDNHALHIEDIAEIFRAWGADEYVDFDEVKGDASELSKQLLEAAAFLRHLKL